MCRWMAWVGQPVLVEELLFRTQHGIVDQALHARMGAEPTNGDGFGIGWYVDALDATVGLVEETARRHGVSSDLPGMWHEIPQSSAVTVGGGG